MTAVTMLRRVVAQERPLARGEMLLAATAVGGVLAVTAALPEGAGARWVLAAAICLVLACVCLRSSTQGVILTLAWLLVLGLTRRLVSEVLADPARDPLLLVGPLAAALLCGRALLQGALRARSRLSLGVLALSAIVLVEVLNPRNPSAGAALAGLLIWLIPMLWFFVGRRLVDDQLARRVLVLAGIGTLAGAAYGVAQSVAGFPPWDELWIGDRGYAALYIGPETVRPFGLFASAAEFAVAAAVGAVLAAVLVFAPRFVGALAKRPEAEPHPRALRVRACALVAFLVLAVALVLSAVRTYVALLVVALPVVYLILRGWRGLRVLVPVTAVAAIAVVGVAQINPDQLSRDGVEAALRRIVVAVRDPFGDFGENPDATLELHLGDVRRGFREAFDEPLGSGTGSTGIAGEHFGGTRNSTDADVADAGIAFGIPGLVATLFVLVAGLVTAVRAAVRRRNLEHLALVGILIVSLGVWWAGGHYAMAPLLWLLLGRADAQRPHVARVAT